MLAPSSKALREKKKLSFDKNAIRRVENCIQKEKRFVKESKSNVKDKLLKFAFR